jgi:hypothetical protein
MLRFFTAPRLALNPDPPFLRWVLVYQWILALALLLVKNKNQALFPF